MPTANPRQARILVTGATGFIGRKLALRLAAAGHDVLCMTRTRDSIEGMRTVRADLLDPRSLYAACRDVDVICNCAGALGKWRLPEDALWNVNVKGPENLLRAAGRGNVKYFIHFSTAGVTGPTGRGPASEYTSCHPRTPYQRSKLQGERNALKTAARLGMPLCVLRPAFVYGPGDPHKLALFKVVKKRRFFFIGDGRSTIHPVHVDDLLDGVLLALARRPSGEVYNIAGPRPVTVRELVNTMAGAMQVTAPHLTVPAHLAWAGAALLEGLGLITGKEPPLTRSRVMMLSSSHAADIAKAKKQLRYKPRIDLAAGIRETVAWYTRHGLLQ